MMRIAMSGAAVVCLLAAPAVGQFDPNYIPGWEDDVVTSIQVSNMTGIFTTDPSTAPGSLGMMDIVPKTGGPVVTVYYQDPCNAPWTVPAGEDGIVYILLNLFKDRSGQPPLGPDQAKGDFNGDGRGDPDWELGWDNIPTPGGPVDVTFLEGTVQYFLVDEYMNTGMLSGSGQLVATGGYLADEAGWPKSGEVSSVTSFMFDVYEPGHEGDPNYALNISDFSEAFTGDVYLTFLPDDSGVPEPTTMALLLGGGLAAVALRRRRR